MSFKGVFYPFVQSHRFMHSSRPLVFDLDTYAKKRVLVSQPLVFGQRSLEKKVRSQISRQEFLKVLSNQTRGKPLFAVVKIMLTQQL